MCEYVYDQRFRVSFRAVAAGRKFRSDVCETKKEEIDERRSDRVVDSGTSSREFAPWRIDRDLVE